MATATLSKSKTDRVLKLVSDYGDRWHFSFNASKSAILVYGECKSEYQTNSKARSFKLGQEKVPEKATYDHVGVKASIFDDNESRVCEKISKGRRTLNAITGLGIRKRGHSMKVCNIIFWGIVIPIVTFGCKAWVLLDKDIENLLSFHRFSEKRIQRFKQSSHNSCAFYGLGWSRITTFISIK